MILYIENPKEATRKLLELINEYSKEGYKKIHRNPIHSYTLTRRYGEREIKDTIPFSTASRMQYLRINLPKETKDLYIENFKLQFRSVQSLSPVQIFATP